MISTLNPNSFSNDFRGPMSLDECELVLLASMFPNFNKEYRQNSGMRLSRVVAVSSTKERARCVRDMHSTFDRHRLASWG